MEGYVTQSYKISYHYKVVPVENLEARNNTLKWRFCARMEALAAIEGCLGKSRFSNQLSHLRRKGLKTVGTLRNIGWKAGVAGR
jgi:hypothetical protein